MSEKSREQISALIDGELETGSVFILSAMSNNEEFRQAWNRYHLIGEALRGHVSEHYDSDFVRRISESLEDEPDQQFPVEQTRPFLKPVAGFAIAASVAIMAIIGVRQVGVTPGPESAPAGVVAGNQSAPANTMAQEHSAVAVAGTTAAARPDQYRTLADAEARLNRYLVNYNEYRTNTGVQGMLPYVRIVAHEVEE